MKNQNGIILQNLSLRQMAMDVQTDFEGLKEILDHNSDYLDVYQFENPFSDSLEIQRLSEGNRNKILVDNGLKHIFEIDFEVLTIVSFDSKFINAIECDPIFKNRIEERKC